MHTSIMKEMWECLEELYLESNNLNRAYDVVQEPLSEVKRRVNPFHNRLQDGV